MAYKGHRINPTRFEKSQIKIIVILLPLVIFMALPIIFIINHAFKPMEELFAFPPFLPCLARPLLPHSPVL